MAHTKRQKVPRIWPIEKKGSKFVVRPFRSLESSVPVLIVLRDMLKVAQNRKEAKKIINSKNALLNEKPIKNEKNAVLLFDVIKIIPSKKSFRLEINEKGKFVIMEITEKEANKKTSKIKDKKILKGKKIQLNLNDGRNFLSDIKCNVGDSAIINLKDRKIEKILSLKEKSNAFVFAGKHAGKKGVIEKISLEKKTVEITTSEKEKFSALIKQIIVIE